LCQSTIESLYEATGGMKQFPGLLKKIIANKAWERRLSKGKVIELASLRELITEKPVRGWGEDPERITAILTKTDPEVELMFRDAMKGQGNHLPKSREHNCNNVTVMDDDEKIKTGNSRAYSIDRVKRECEPEVVAKVMAGQMSPNAALVKAGIRENRQVYVPREPAKAVDKLRAMFGDDFVLQMAEHVLRS